MYNKRVQSDKQFTYHSVKNISDEIYLFSNGVNLTGAEIEMSINN